MRDWPGECCAPDLTAGGVPTDNDQWNLGPTGMAGWCYRDSQATANARQFFVRSVAGGSPAAGIMAVNDVILGASGTAPYDCPKSRAILEKGLQWMMTTNADDGNWRYSALTLLAANDPSKGAINTARQTKATTELRQRHDRRGSGHDQFQRGRRHRNALRLPTGAHSVTSNFFPGFPPASVSNSGP